MLGAICGDILGSTYEYGNERFDDIDKVPLFIAEDHFTDDTVLSLAVADWLMHDCLGDTEDEDKLRRSLAA